MQSKKTPSLTEAKRIRVGCPAHNCGGRCLLIAHVRDGRIIRLDTDDRPDTVAAPQLRACVRGRSYLRRQYHPDRLTHPLKRVGPRGSGEFHPISWEEALDTRRLPDGEDQAPVWLVGLICPVWHRLLQSTERLARCPAVDESLWRLSGHLQFLLLGRHQPGNAHRVRHARHRQPAPGLAECQNTS